MGFELGAPAGIENFGDIRHDAEFWHEQLGSAIMVAIDWQNVIGVIHAAVSP